MHNATGGLPRGAILFVVNQWIGVSGGYLGDFTYRTHQDFYAEFCDIEDIDTCAWSGTTRARFIAILEAQPPERQRRILKGVLLRFPPGSGAVRTAANHQRIATWINQLAHSGVQVDQSGRPLPEIARTALDAIQRDRRSGKPELGVDRAVTALQACLHALRDEGGWEEKERATLVESFSRLRENHPAFRVERGDRALADLLKHIGGAIDALNRLRNAHSLVHANPTLDPIEARLVLDCAESLIHYIWSRASATTNEHAQPPDQRVDRG